MKKPKALQMKHMTCTKTNEPGTVCDESDLEIKELAGPPVSTTGATARAAGDTELGRLV